MNMDLWLEMACPICHETQPMSQQDKRRFAAKHPRTCTNGHQYSRADGFFTWVLEKSELGSALILADTALEGVAQYTGQPELGAKLPYSLRGAEISAVPTEEWKALRGDIDYATVWRSWAFITLRDTVYARRQAAAGAGLTAARFQVVGARRPGGIPGWRQAMGESIVALEEGRTNVSVLLANIAVECKYSSIADRRLRRRGMTDKVIIEMHGHLSFEFRLREKFGKAFNLPRLSDAPFWADWLRQARAPRNPLAHSWRFERRGKPLATEHDARRAVFLHLKAILHLDEKAFDWLMNLQPKAVGATAPTA